MMGRALGCKSNAPRSFRSTSLRKPSEKPATRRSMHHCFRRGLQTRFGGRNWQERARLLPWCAADRAPSPSTARSFWLCWGSQMALSALSSGISPKRRTSPASTASHTRSTTPSHTSPAQALPHSPGGVLAGRAARALGRRSRAVCAPDHRHRLVAQCQGQGPAAGVGRVA